MSEVVNAYTEYVKARKEARLRARESVQAELRPHLAELGKFIEEAQKDGMSVSDIARLLGIKNRNFIYDAKRAYAAERGEKPNVREYVRTPNQGTDGTTDDSDNDSKEQAVADDEPTYNIEDLGGGNYCVTVLGDEFYLNKDEDTHRVIFPEEWADASPSSLAIYREIIKKIEGRA